MKRVLIAAVLGVLCIYGLPWAVTAMMKRTYSSRQWPEHLGTIDAVAARFPDADQNAAANKLEDLFPSVDIKPVKEPIGEYNRVELERVGEQVQPPPASVAEFIAQHDAAIDATRDHILTAGPIVWTMRAQLGHEAPIPNLLVQMQLMKLFTARSLSKAANHDAASWDDLHANWLVAQPLLRRPEIISQLVGLAGVRMTNAAAAKMPLPVPSWFTELQSFDYRHSFIGSYQSEAWMTWTTKANLGVQPYFDAMKADTVEGMRAWTTELASTNRCDVTPVKTIKVAWWNELGKVALPNLAGAWQRFARFQAELEATDKILAARRGETPSRSTRCADGAWQVSANEVKFSRDISVPPPGIKYALAYKR